MFPIRPRQPTLPCQDLSRLGARRVPSADEEEEKPKDGKKRRGQVGSRRWRWLGRNGRRGMNEERTRARR
uniref:Uncharacterized protein n=1 Tax=Oryza sativa subsp. japonica TaxID=39947 RepID=Q6ZGS7_ORYSJ|nr:hypothetical protein [Oryza sativa Japonica Group]